MQTSLRLLFAPLASLLLSCVIVLQGHAGAEGSEDHEATRFLDQGRIGIYKARRAMVNELRAEIAAMTSKYRELSSKYKERHPRLLAVSEQIEVLRDEMEQARAATRKSVMMLSVAKRATLTELYKTELELEAAKKRAALASLRTRYKERFPTVIQAKAQLATLERSLEAFDQVGIDQIASDPTGFERIQLQCELIAQNAELERIQLRYRDKHPTVLSIKNKISSIQDELAALNDPPKPSREPAALNKAQARSALLKEEIALVESHLKQIDSGGLPTRRDPQYQNQTRLELLQLRQALAAQEGNTNDVEAYLKQQATLLNTLIKSSTSPDHSYTLRRQLIAVQRAQLELRD